MEAALEEAETAVALSQRLEQAGNVVGEARDLAHERRDQEVAERRDGDQRKRERDRDGLPTREPASLERLDGRHERAGRDDHLRDLRLGPGLGSVGERRPHREHATTVATFTSMRSIWRRTARPSIGNIAETLRQNSSVRPSRLPPWCGRPRGYPRRSGIPA